MKEPSSIIERTQDVLGWYQAKIGNYDKQLWEQSVEQRILKGLENRPKKKEGSLNQSLIDVDLVRGSAFTKAKPQHHWSAVLRKGIQRVVLFPCYLSWWQQHTSKHITRLLFLVYIMQFAQAGLIFFYDKVFEEVHSAEVLIPMVLILFLGVLHSQIVSTYGNKKSGAALGFSGRSGPGIAGSTNVASSVSGKRQGGHSRSGLRSSKVKKQRMRSSQMRMKTTNANNPTSLSPGESGAFDGETTGAEAEKLAVFISAKNKPVPDPVVWSKEAKGNATGSGPSGVSGRRRHRSWRFGSTSECPRESPLRSLPTSGNSTSIGKSSPGMPSPFRSPSAAGGEKESVAVFRNGSLEEKFLVETVPSDEEEIVEVTGLSVRKPTTPSLEGGNRASVETLLMAQPDFASSKQSVLTGHSEDLRSKQPLRMPMRVEGELMVEGEHRLPEEFLPTASPVDSAFAESDVAKKSGSSSRTSSASSADSKRHSRAESTSSSVDNNSPKMRKEMSAPVNVTGDNQAHVEAVRPEVRINEEQTSSLLVEASASPSVIVTPVSEESERSERDGHDRKSTGEMRCRRPLRFRHDAQRSALSLHSRSRSPSPGHLDQTGEDASLQPSGVAGSCHESSNDDTYTSMSKRRVEFAHLFRLRSGRRPRRSGGGGGGGGAGGAGMSGVMEDMNADGFEQDLADESSAEDDSAQRLGEASGGAGGGAGGMVGVAGGAGSNTGGGGSVADGTGGVNSAAPGTAPGATARYLCEAERSPTHKFARSAFASYTPSDRLRTVQHSIERPMSQASETEYDRINSDVGSSYSSSETDNTENGEGDLVNQDTTAVEDPFVLWFRQSQPKQQHAKAQHKDTISCYVWEGEELKKSDLTMLDIGWSIIQAVERCPTERHYIRYGLFMSVLLSLGPLLFRVYLHREVLWQLPHATLDIPIPQLVLVYMPSLLGHILFGRRWLTTFAVLLGVVLRCLLYLMLFFLLCVAERTFAQRLQYAKHFSYLTSSRRARKYYLPHFRLNKVSNIKSWLSLRSYLKKRGPQRSVDCIITSIFYIMLTVLALLCVHLLQASDTFLNNLLNWDLLLVAFAMGLYLLRFMTLGTKIMKKFRNLSVLITEQINLYLSMERKPHKKDELMLAKNVLKLAEELLKELDGPFRICGWSMNPLVYNIIKVVILSAFSAVLTEMLGFKLKLYKIKLNPINW